MADLTITLTHDEKLAVIHAVQQMAIQAHTTGVEAERAGADHATHSFKMAADLRGVLARLLAGDGEDIFAQFAD